MDTTMSEPATLATTIYPEPKAPIHLCPKGTDTVVAWACGACGSVKASAESATSCCACWHCGKRIESGPLVKSHKACREATDAERNTIMDCERAVKEARHLLAVTPIPVSAYADPVFYNDRLVMDANELDVDQALPAFVFGTTRHALHVNAEAALENALEQDEMHEDAGDSVSADAKAALETAIDAWNEQYGSKVVSYTEERSEIVVLNQEAFDKVLDAARDLLAEVTIVQVLCASLYLLDLATVSPFKLDFVWTYKPWIQGAWWSVASS